MKKNLIFLVALLLCTQVNAQRISQPTNTNERPPLWMDELLVDSAGIPEVLL
ncbi:MAG: hypothetical protein RL226_1348, partial [Bacteroidota bacterium]